LALHNSLSIELLRYLGVKPDLTPVTLINELIDAEREKKGELLDEVRRLVGEFKFYDV
jgi:hypothetical protein